jgi:hypothetical protein
MYNISDEIFKSIHLITDRKIQELKLDRTVQVTIVSQVQNDQYRISYQGVEYDAFALTSETFTSNQSVFMLIPENNFSNKKFILGLTSKVPKP